MFMFGPNVTFAGISNHYVHMCIPTKSVFACQPRGVGRYARALVDAGFRVLAFDLYGHGATDAPDMELAPMAFVLFAVLFEGLNTHESNEPSLHNGRQCRP